MAKGRIELNRVKGSTEADIARWKAQDGVDDSAFGAARLVTIGPDVRAIRERLRLSQEAFADRFGLSLRTVQDWEQGRRVPEGPARVLLQVIDGEPAAVERALAGSVDSNQEQTGYSIFGRAELTLEAARHRIDEELGKAPGLFAVVDQLGSYVFMAAQKLIERKAQTEQSRARDEAIIYLCPRLFSECLAGVLLARSGLPLQSIVLLRSALEVTTRMILFLDREQSAISWLRGKQISQGDARRLSEFARHQADRYESLVRLSHPNLESLGYYSIPYEPPMQSAHWYGGTFVPKMAGQLVVQFQFAQLTFLEAFYEHYEQDLLTHQLLWTPEVQKMIDEGSRVATWREWLGVWRSALLESVDYLSRLPDDLEELARHLRTTYGSKRQPWKAG